MDKQLAQLEALLKRLTEGHERLLKLLEQKRGALRSADRARVTDLCEQENRCVQEISEMEKARLGLMGELTLLLNPHAAQPMGLREFAERLDEPARGKLLVLRQTLRERMLSARKQTQVLQRTTESLVAHMQGLVQTVGGAMTGLTVYTTQGTVACGGDCGQHVQHDGVSV